MATTEFIAAIELGSSKITGVAGKKNSDGSMQVLAYAQEDSSTFIRKGVIFNLDKTAQSLTSIINRLEGELKNSIAKVYVGIGGQSLRTVRNVVSRDLEEEAIISEELVSAIGDENIAIPVVDMDILDVAPQEYKVGNNLQANPVGLVGSHIEGRFLNIVARASVRKNLEHCFQQAKIDIADQLIAPLVTANAVLTESERRSGCALIDFGADTTTISVYKNNILRFLTVLPLGGNSITRDITTLQMEEEEAERLKKADKMLDLVKLKKHKKHLPNQMSGGQQQRVGVARALVVDPKIIFADEPTGNLDSRTSREVMALMQQVVREQKKTLVMVTHDDHLAGYADRIFHIIDGKIVKVEDNRKKAREHAEQGGNEQ